MSPKWKFWWNVRSFFWHLSNAEYVRDRERYQRFMNLTGLHGTYAWSRRVPDDEVIALQARKIRGLEMQLNQQRRGYLRKIARLQQVAPHPNTRTGGEGDA